MKHIYISLLCMLLLSTACTHTQQEIPTEEGIEQPITEISWWAFPVFGQDAGMPAGTYERSVIEAFEKENPDIHITLETLDYTTGTEKLAHAVETGTAPDVLLDAPGRIMEYARQGELVVLDELFTKEFLEDAKHTAIVDACKIQDKAYFYPLSSAPCYMVINRRMWESSGAMAYVNLEDDRTWHTDAFEKALQCLHDAGYAGGTLYCADAGGDQGTRAFLSNLYGAKIADEALTTYTFHDEQGIAALTRAKQWIDEGLLGDGTIYNGSDDVALFISANTAFTLCWNPVLAYIHRNTLQEHGVEAVALPFPTDISQAEPELEYLINGFGIFQQQDNMREQAAKRFIRFACDDEQWGPNNVIQTGAFAVRNSYGDLYASSSMYKLLEGWTKFYGTYYNGMENFAQMRSEWYKMLQQVISGEKTPDQAANDYDFASNHVQIPGGDAA